jgi:hypothetical protein
LFPDVLRVVILLADWIRETPWVLTGMEGTPNPAVCELRARGTLLPSTQSTREPERITRREMPLVGPYLESMERFAQVLRR